MLVVQRCLKRFARTLGVWCILLAYIATLTGFPVASRESSGAVAACGCSLEKRESGTCCCRPSVSSLPACCAARKAEESGVSRKLSAASELVKSAGTVTSHRKSTSKRSGGWIVVIEAMKCRGESGFWFLAMDSAVPPPASVEWLSPDAVSGRFLPPPCGFPAWTHSIPELPG